MVNPSSFRIMRLILGTSEQAVRLPDENIVDGIAVVTRAFPANVGDTWIGPDADVNKVDGNRVRLTPGQSLGLHVSNLQTIWLSGDRAGAATDGVEIIYERNV